MTFRLTKLCSENRRERPLMTFGLTVQASDIVAGDTLWQETRTENARRRHCLI